MCFVDIVGKSLSFLKIKDFNCGQKNRSGLERFILYTFVESVSHSDNSCSSSSFSRSFSEWIS